jgi:plasmid stabilization system protein ParE
VRKLTLRRNAQRDIDAAVTWYEDHELGLGLRLLDAVHVTIARLVETPEQFPVISPGVRRALVCGFPYAVYFKAARSSVIVLAVVHLRRRPGTWRQRKR